MQGLLTVVASPVALPWLWSSGYMVVAHGLSGPVACGVVPDQGISKPVSPALASGFFTVESSRKPHQEK